MELRFGTKAHTEAMNAIRRDAKYMTERELWEAYNTWKATRGVFAEMKANIYLAEIHRREEESV